MQTQVLPQATHFSQSSAVVLLRDQILDYPQFAELLHVTVDALKFRRYKDPHAYPPPFQQRPLLWRRATVEKWMAEQEREGEKRLSRRYRARLKKPAAVSATTIESSPN